MVKKIHLIDYGFGNLPSVKNAIEFLNHECVIVNKSTKLKEITHIILPGVGSFESGISALIKQGWQKKINSLVKNNVYLLGICLGMQLLFTNGHNEKNNKKIKGLGLIKGTCERFFSKKKQNLPLPHVGFNSVNHNKSKIWNNIVNNSYFYFIHSHKISLTSDNKDFSYSTSDYGEKFISFVEKKNIFGSQFHPEKSNESGIQLLKNFCNL